MATLGEDWQAKVVKIQWAVAEAHARGQALLQRAEGVLERAEQTLCRAWESQRKVQESCWQTQKLLRAVRSNRRQKRDTETEQGHNEPFSFGDLRKVRNHSK